MTLPTPITVFSLNEIGIDFSKFQSNLQNLYNQYEPDYYLLQQYKINVLQEFVEDIEPQLLYDIYNSLINDEQLKEMFATRIPGNALEQVTLLKPTRWRCISEYDLMLDGNEWIISRVQSKPFEQNKALTADNAIDYRLSPRKFKELPEKLFDEDLKKIIIYTASRVKLSRQLVSKLKFIIHHTIVYSFSSQTSSNSPEGVHQDGMDYIVSALVIDRVNVKGGKSVIYGADKKTPIFETILQVGQGIFQPDLNTDLWHEVTPTYLIDKEINGFRSTIGFDIEVIE